MAPLGESKLGVAVVGGNRLFWGIIDLEAASQLVQVPDPLEHWLRTTNLSTVMVDALVATGSSTQTGVAITGEFIYWVSFGSV